ncbi:MAG: 5-formyltetrahydrofolate cyclo-ligase, partial [Gammaproteobacteria bacterium]
QRGDHPAGAALAVAAETRRARAVARARRDALPADEHADASKAITARCLADPLVATSRSVFAFLSAAQEVHTHDIVDALLARGATVLVPYLVDRETMLAVPFPGWAQLTPGRLGILSPPPAPAWTGRVDLVLVPGLAFTIAGARLGYGGGYYDRWLATQRPRHTAALAFECQLCTTLPCAPHDQPLERIFTEQRTIECGRAADSR